MTKALTIAGHALSVEVPAFIVAECCNNFQNSPEIALRMVDEACAMGAHAVKFQHRGRLSLLQLEVIAQRARHHGRAFLCTAYTPQGLFDAAPLVDAIKLGSAEILDPEMRAAALHVAGVRPIIASTGGCTEANVAEIVAHLGAHRGGLVLMHTTSEYPTMPSRAALGVIPAWQSRYGSESCQIGYSDHTGRVMFPIAAITLGATLIEAHFTLHRRLPGPDQVVSHEPADLAALCDFARAWPRARSADKRLHAAEVTKLSLFRKVWAPEAPVTEGDAP